MKSSLDYCSYALNSVHFFVSAYVSYYCINFATMPGNSLPRLSVYLYSFIVVGCYGTSFGTC